MVNEYRLKFFFFFLIRKFYCYTQLSLDYIWYYPRSSDASMCTQIVNPEPDWKEFEKYINK